MAKYYVKGKVSVDIYIEADSEEEAENKAWVLYEDNLDVILPGLDYVFVSDLKVTKVQ